MINQSLHKCRLRFCRTSWQKCIFHLFKAVLWLRGLVANQPAWRSRFDPRLVHVGFILHKAAFGQVSLRVLQFSPVTIIPPVLTVILSMCHRKYVIALSPFVSVSYYGRNVAEICVPTFCRRPWLCLCFLASLHCRSLFVTSRTHRTRKQDDSFISAESERTLVITVRCSNSSTGIQSGGCSTFVLTCHQKCQLLPRGFLKKNCWDQNNTIF